MKKINTLNFISDFYYREVARYDSGFVYEVLPPRAWAGCSLCEFQDLGNIASAGVPVW